MGLILSYRVHIPSKSGLGALNRSETSFQAKTQHKSDNLFPKSIPEGLIFVESLDSQNQFPRPTITIGARGFFRNSALFQGNLTPQVQNLLYSGQIDQTLTLTRAKTLP